MTEDLAEHYEKQLLEKGYSKEDAKRMGIHEAMCILGGPVPAHILEEVKDNEQNQ